MSIYQYLEEHPQDAQIFGEAVGVFHAQSMSPIAAAHDLSPYGTIVDIGGGTDRCWQRCCTSIRRREASCSNRLRCSHGADVPGGSRVWRIGSNSWPGTSSSRFRQATHS